MVCPVQEIALSDRSFAHDVIVDGHAHPLASTKWIEVSAAKVRECNLISVVYVKHLPVPASADNVVLFRVIGDEPIERTKGNFGLLLH